MCDCVTNAEKFVNLFDKKFWLGHPKDSADDGTSSTYMLAERLTPQGAFLVEKGLTSKLWINRREFVGQAEQNQLVLYRKHPTQKFASKTREAVQKSVSWWARDVIVANQLRSPGMSRIGRGLSISATHVR